MYVAADGDPQAIGPRALAALGGGGHALLLASSPENAVTEFARSVAASMEASPRVLDCRFLYDARGSALYEKICEQPEYYPTRTEDGILSRHAEALPSLTGPLTVVELGSGSSAKTRRILAAYQASGCLAGYVPVDFSASALRGALASLATDLPDVRVSAVQGTYERAFEVARHLGPVLFVFLGSTIGNLFPPQAEAFWQRVRADLPVGSHILLGVDLVKDAEILNRAYDDAAGVTRAFTLNLFSRMNRELDAGLDVAAIHHRSRWVATRSRVEIHAQFSTPQRLYVAPLSRAFHIRRGERILVEISRKFKLATLSRELARHGLRVHASWTDDRRWFATLLLAREPTEGASGGL